MLRDRNWRIRYTPDDGDLVRLFYVPALQDAVRYHRLTGYFSAGALALAARGIEGLVRNDGHMRLLVGCTLEAEEIAAIERGEALREQVERRLAQLPLAPPDAEAGDALELLAWMIGRGHLDVKVAVPCNADGVPVPDGAIFHEKAGIVEDGAGDRIAWNGSLNETPAGWQRNWESVHVYASWEDRARVETEEENFSRLWANRSPRLEVLDVPSAVRQDLMRFLPKDDLPKRLQSEPSAGEREGPAPRMKEPSAGEREGLAPRMEDVPKRQATPQPLPPTQTPVDLRTVVWRFIEQAPSLPDGGAQVGVATAAVDPWPHQVRAFQRMYMQWPPKLLLADEVGLGKTIQAGMLLRQAWLAGKAKRILILAPKAVLAQWQIELREKFNLDWPVYDGKTLRWLPSRARQVLGEPDSAGSAWHEQPAVIVSSQLMRRQERAAVLLEKAEPWDVIVLDEAHHARRRSSATQEDRPNALLRLMRALKERTEGLLLLTATPMQVHPIETWDLLDLLGLPAAWSSDAFLGFFEDVEAPNPSAEAMERLALLFRSVERAFGEVSREQAERITGRSRLQSGKLLRALRDEATIPRRQLTAQERRAALALMRSNTPIRHLVSRHTRQLLRRYAKAGRLGSPIAERDVEDRFLPMTAEEQALYEAVETYISNAYDQAAAAERSAVGFVMTVYRRRVASSFQALRRTFERRLAAMDQREAALLEYAEEDAPDDELADIDESDDLEHLAREALVADERAQIVALLDRARALPPDSKLASLKAVLAELREQGYRQAMVFTQFTDTMDFLRDALRQEADARLMCFSGRGGEVPATDGATWRQIGRDDAKRHFRAGEADVLLCTDAAAEGLNFQFCGAVVNYDMPWNPMRVEQRIGRIDRLGQAHPRIRIVNLHYEGTVETDVYRALRERIQLFETVVGRLQPILAQLPGAIASAVLAKTAGGPDAARRNAVAALERQTAEAQAAGFDLDAAVDAAELALPPAPPSPLTMDDLEQLIGRPDLMPPDAELRPLGNREHALRMAGMTDFVRVTTNPAYYEEHAESMELWSPGSAVFKAPEDLGEAPGSAESLRAILAKATGA